MSFYKQLAGSAAQLWDQEGAGRQLWRCSRNMHFRSPIHQVLKFFCLGFVRVSTHSASRILLQFNRYTIA
jgi:hypothetical protein